MVIAPMARYGRVIENGVSKKVLTREGTSVRPIFGGNWKMHGAKQTVGIDRSLDLALQVNLGVHQAKGSTDVFIAPPTAYLVLHAQQASNVAKNIAARDGEETFISLAAQNPYPGMQKGDHVLGFGAATGQTSIAMIKDMASYTGVEIPYLIVGHSEPRSSLGLSEAMTQWVMQNTSWQLRTSGPSTAVPEGLMEAVAQRALGMPEGLINLSVREGLKQGFQIVLCVGETLAERNLGMTERVVLGQVESGLDGVEADQAGEVVIAYEPVWAIGTGETATPEQAQAVHHQIRQRLAGLFNLDIAAGTRIQYGGSMKPGNVDALMAQPDIDGGLIGGAALDASSFGRIVNYRAI